MHKVQPTELTVLLRRRRERDEAKQQIVYAGYDIYWPDGRPVSVGLRRFCRHGARLLVGRAGDPDQALIKLSLYPVAGSDAARTRPGPGVRCRRFYALRSEDAIRLHFLVGEPTEVVFELRRDEAAVLQWLQAERIRPSEPFWFDLASQVLHQNCEPVTASAG